MRREADNDAPTTMPTPVGYSPGQMARAVDPWMTGAFVFLVGIGTVLVYSASSVRGLTVAGNGSLYLFRHLSSVFIGLILVAGALRVPVESWSKLAYPLLGLTILLLVAVYIPGVGHRVKGAVRWIRVAGLNFQPAELAKLSVVIYLAHSLAKKREKVSSFSIGFLPHVLMTSVIVALIILQPDLGTSAVIYATLGLMLFVAGTRIGYLVLALVAALPVGYSYVATHPHAAARLKVFLEPEAYKKDIGYQIWESIVAFGSGGPWGTGLGAGKQKLHFLPEAHTDFIFAMLGQELGFLGVCLVVGAFGILIFRAFLFAARMPCRFPMYLAFGLAAWLGMQALANMAVAVALLPTKGLTLPFLSFGRSSLIISMLGFGILLRASAEYRLQRRPSGASRRRKTHSKTSSRSSS